MRHVRDPAGGGVELHFRLASDSTMESEPAYVDCLTAQLAFTYTLAPLEQFPEFVDRAKTIHTSQVTGD